MASFKETSVSRPFAQTGALVRQPASRNHSHSISLGAVNANHRVTRRKSMTTTAAVNAAVAVAASLKDNGEPAGMPVMASHRRALSGRKGSESTSMGAASGFSSYLSRSINAASLESASGRKHSPSSIDENTAVDGTGPVGKPVSTKDRNRRASEGSHLMRGEGKHASTELRCDQCGKGYKHSSCLTKHMWEHDPAWAVTSKLLISKHQQVQLLEAATVLVAMNAEPTSLADESDNSSASPAASSELRDGTSSTETTPPPMDDEMADFDKRYTSTSAFSRSYQSVASSSYADSGPLHSPAFSHFRQSSVDTRPSTAETTGPPLEDGAEAEDLAAAIRLCNFGTPRSNAVSMSSEVPPVPPLPARYLSQQGSSGLSGHGSLGVAGSKPTLFNSLSLDPSHSYKVSDERDVKMGDADRESRHRRNNDVDFGSRQAHDDDDDGVFGLMEE